MRTTILAAVLFLVGCADDRAIPSDPVVSAISCVGQLEPTRLTFAYTVTEYADGRIEANGRINIDGVTGGSSAVFQPSEGGYALTPVAFELDVMGAANGGHWQMSFDRRPRIGLFMYKDPDALDGFELWTPPPTDCTTP